MELPCPHYTTTSQVSSKLPVGQMHAITALQFDLLFLPFLINNYTQEPPPKRLANDPLHIVI